MSTHPTHGPLRVDPCSLCGNAGDCTRSVPLPGMACYTMDAYQSPVQDYGMAFTRRRHDRHVVSVRCA